jgi:L-aspartate oxidase
MKNKYDVVIIGSGVAGLSAASKISEKYKILIISKTNLTDTTTFQAQGGIALPVSKNDIQEHINDTLIAGQNFNDKKIVKFIIENGYDIVRELIDSVFEFDKDKDGKLLLTKEGGHSCRRILHWGGDITGQGIQTNLLKHISSKKNVSFIENRYVSKLLKKDNRIAGVKIVNTDSLETEVIFANSVILATGGCSGVYREHTGCESIIGDGIALAYNIGAEIIDMEFIQFHPTTFYFPGAPRFLITEAVRGEGAYLVNNFNERFMKYYDAERMELAPRDIVSRSILFEIIKTNSSNVFLDLTSIETSKIKSRFPNIYNFCLKYKCNITKDLVPVFPAAHYSIGGIRTNQDAETNISGLFAAGECACSGFHGANRLASNSLLEGVVMGNTAGSTVNIYLKNKVFKKTYEAEKDLLKASKSMTKYSINISDFKSALRNLMWKNVGILTEQKLLDEALYKLKRWEAYLLDIHTADYRLIELKNMIKISEMIIQSASWRKESRGTHYRKDYSFSNEKFNIHLIHKNEESYEIKN